MKIISCRSAGFTLIEVIVFIVVVSILMSTVMLASVTALRGAPDVHQQWVAINTASRCMEWFLDQRRIGGYDLLACPSNPSPAACAAPSGFSVSTSIACTTRDGDANYKTITVAVSGLASVTLSMQIGNYQ